MVSRSSAHFWSAWQKVNLNYFLTSEKLDVVPSNNLFMQCNQAQNLTQLSRSLISSSVVSTSARICCFLTSNCISCFEFHYRKKFLVGFFNLL